MSWVRIHAGALTHPKIVGLVNYRDPLHLWVWGLSYAQMHLTDGYISREAIPAGTKKAEQTLILRKLWEPDDRGGIRVHDYTAWNNSRDVVTSKRGSARERMASVRANKLSEQPERTISEQPERTTDEHGERTFPAAAERTPLLDLKRSVLEKEPEKKPFAEARSKRPIFVGQRLVVFEWMWDDIRKTLGNYTDDFNLDQWFYDLDAKAMRLNLVIPKRDQGAWLQAQLVEEAARRGLNMAGAVQDPHANFPTAWHCPTCGELHEGTQEQGRKRVCTGVSA
jgi:hypothetical protein